jgi:hypothetical protein
VKKEQNGRKSLRRLKATVGCNASKRKRKRCISKYCTLQNSTLSIHNILEVALASAA